MIFHNKKNNISGNIITVFVHNVRSLSKHIDDIVSDDRIRNYYIKGFTETQTNPSDSTCEIMEILNFFNIDFNNYHNKYLSLAYCYRNDVAILEKFEANGVSTFSFKKMLLLTEYSLYVSL